jgi:hypothetical protein
MSETKKQNKKRNFLQKNQKISLFCSLPALENRLKRVNKCINSKIIQTLYLAQLDWVRLLLHTELHPLDSLEGILRLESLEGILRLETPGELHPLDTLEGILRLGCNGDDETFLFSFGCKTTDQLNQ